MYRVGDKVFHKGTEAEVITVHLKTGDLFLRDKDGETWIALQALVEPVEATDEDTEDNEQ
jgi:hypothetical protein